MDHEELKSKVGKSATKIWDAYQEVVGELKALEKTASISASAEAAKIEHAIKAAEGVDVDKVAATLESLAAGLRGAKEEFDEIQIAISDAKAQLENVHGIQAEADSLVALVQAKDRLVAERSEQAASILADANEKAAEIRQAAADEVKETRERCAADEANDKQARERTQSEWDYDFERKKTAQIDEVGDIIAKRLKALKEQEDAVKEREAAADEKDGEITSLQAKLDKALADTDTKVEDALEEGKKKAERSFGFQKQIIEKDHEGKIRVLESTNESLRERLAEMQARLTAAEAQIDAAGKRVTDIATASLSAQGDAATISRVAEVAAGAGQKK